MKTLFSAVIFMCACYLAQAAGVFVIESGKAQASDLRYVIGCRSVSIVGYVERPGIYFFREPIPLCKLVELAGVKPYKDGFETDLTRVRFLEFTSDGLSKELKTIDMKRLIELEKRDDLWLMRGGEVVELQWLMR